MKTLSKKFMSLFLALTMVFSLSATAFAAEPTSPDSDIDLISITEKYIVVENGFFTIEDENALKTELESNWETISSELDSNMTVDDIISSLEYRFQELNQLSTTQDIIIDSDGEIYDNTVSTYRSSRDQETTHHWWGVKHTFYTDDSAHRYARSVRRAAHLNAGAAVLAGAIFGGVGAIPNGLSAVYGYSIADDVDYFASQPGNGVELKINWTLIYKCSAR